MHNITYRYNTVEDEVDIRNCIENSFGLMLESLWMPYVTECKYYVAEADGKVIGMTGLFIDEDGFNEVSWSCVHPDYRKHGIFTELLKEMVRQSGGRLRYSAWRVGDNERSNVQTVLENLGFKQINHGYKVFGLKNGLCEHRKNNMCMYYQGKDCHCFEDMWEYSKEE